MVLRFTLHMQYDVCRHVVAILYLCIVFNHSYHINHFTCLPLLIGTTPEHRLKAFIKLDISMLH